MTDAVAPAWMAIAATSVSPEVEMIGTSKLVPPVVLPVAWRTNPMPGDPPVGVVTAGAAVAGDALRAASKAETA